jgi:uncharacterized protein YwqG
VTSGPAGSDRERLRELVAEVGLDEIAPDLMRLVRASGVGVLGGPTLDGEARSRLGGHPDLPASEGWPGWTAGQLSFIGQLRVDDLAQIDDDGLLPHQGLLSFFYDTVEQPWGLEPADAAGSRVFWFDRLDGLSRRECPKGVPLVTEHTVQFRTVPSLPSWESHEFQRLCDRSVYDLLRSGDGSTVDRFIDLLLRVDREFAVPDTCHRALGFGDQIQGDLHLEADRAVGAERHDLGGECDRDWRLLLQVDSDNDLNTSWGDVGRIYWFVDTNVPLPARFEASPVVLQCA